jgi:hypothetical protein
MTDVFNVFNFNSGLSRVWSIPHSTFPYAVTNTANEKCKYVYWGLQILTSQKWMVLYRMAHNSRDSRGLAIKMPFQVNFVSLCIQECGMNSGRYLYRLRTMTYASFVIRDIKSYNWEMKIFVLRV